MRRIGRFVFLALVTASSAGAQAGNTISTHAARGTKAGAPKAVVLPLFFEANKGQTDSRVRFLTRSSGYTLFLTPSETVLAEAKSLPKPGSGGIGAPPDLNGKATPQAVVRMQLVGANTAPVMTGFKELPGKVNYLIGNDPGEWHTGVPLYSEVRSQQIYQGVDLLFHGDKRQLEYDFIVAPGADPSKIAFRIRGAARIDVDSQGDLVLHTADSEFRMYKPVMYQTVASERRMVDGSFVRKGKHEVAFKIGAYDRAQPLVIDPAIGYSTFLGGAGDDEPADLQVDSTNPAAPKVYVAGYTTDITSFPETSNPVVGSAGGQDYGFIAKIDPTITSGGTGSLDYLTFIGGHVLLTGNSGAVCSTIFEKLSLDLSQGTTSSVEPVVGGLTLCSDYPGTPTQTVGGTTAGVLTRLNAAGTATAASIIFGGNGNDYNIYTFVDSVGNVVVAGGTSSTNLPVTSNAYIPTINNGNTGYADCFVGKLERSNFAPTYMSYLNVGAGTVQQGTGFGGVGIGCGAIEDATGNIDVGGSTLSSVVFNVGADGQNLANGFETSFPSGATKATFAMRLDLDLSGSNELAYGTYFGGGGITNPQTGALSLGNDILAIGGFTSSNSFDDVGDIPLQNAFQSTNLAAASSGGDTGFLFVVDTTQTGAASLLCSTYFGGSSGFDEINSLAYDASDPTAFRILLAGQTGSATDFPAANSLQTFEGTLDGFVSELSVPFPGQTFSATLDFSTFIGGGSNDRIPGVGVDANGTVYAAGRTESSNFFGNTYPVTTVNGFQTSCMSCGGAKPLGDTVVFSLTPAAGVALQSISISPFAATIPADQTQQLQAEGFFSDGTVQDLTKVVAWSSTQTGVATINTQGLITAGSTAGTTTIVALDGNAEGKSTVAVTTSGEFSLTIALNGSAYGTVSSNPVSISCDDTTGVIANTCVGVFAAGSTVTLFEQPSTAAVFGAWSGGGCSGTANPCVVTLNANTTVTATFNNGPGTNSISITPGAISNGMGTGTGTVTSNQFGINCTMSDGVITASSGPCSASFPDGSFVILTATPAAGSVFNFMQGCPDSSFNTCIFLADTPQSATATFTSVSYALQVNGAGTGSGTISSTPPGLSCAIPGPCTANFPIGTVVTLTATPNAGSTFGGWTNFGCTGTGTCTLTMNSAFTVVATFNPVGFPLTVTTAGTGDGGVISTPAGIACDTGSTVGCSATFNTGTAVTLTPTASLGSAFAGWSGACSGTGSCVVTMSAAQAVTATFNTTASFALTVTDAGSGVGTVTSQTGLSPAINCASGSSAGCSANYPAGTPVTLTATANAGATFAGWSGACTGTGTCTVTMSAAESVTATFNPSANPTLAVVLNGTGTGSVTFVSSASYTCSNTTGVVTGTCSASFPSGTVVNMSQVAGNGSVFVGWSGGGCAPTGGVCNVTLTTNTTVTATFNKPTDTLTVSESGTGTGTVTSNPAGIICPSTCTANFTSGATVTLTPVASPGSTFAGWVDENCAESGTGPCTVSLSGGLTVDPVFNKANYTLTLTLAGTGAGTVTSSPAGITCGSGCSASFTGGTKVTLTAAPASGSVFAGWSGAGCSGTGTCSVTMNAAETVTATFNLPPPNFALTVSITQPSSSPGSGAGTGTVTSQAGLVPAIDCASGSTEGCTASYPSGTVVALTATPASGSTFAGWSGACAGTGTCTVTMNATQSVTATFNLSAFTFTTGSGYSTTISTTPGGNIVVGFTLSSNTAATVDLGCTSSAPQYLSCLITPAEVNLTGNGTTQVAIVLTSYCQGSAPGMPREPTPGAPGGVVGVMMLGLTLCGAAFAYRGRRRAALSFALLLFAAVAGAGCGNLPQGTAGATPAGSYTLTVTATVAGQAPQAVQVLVNVN